MLIGLAATATWAGVQQPRATATLPLGVLSVSSSPSVTFGTLTSKADHPGLSLGTLTITDTLGDATPTAWTVSVASSDCAPTSTTLQLSQFAGLQVNNATVASTNLTLSPGAIVLVAGLGTQEVTANAGTTATFGPTSGGLSPPVTVSTGPAGATSLDNNGQWTQTPTLDINLSSVTTIPGAYTCTLQYTITG